MIIIGLVTTREEQNELRFVAQMCILGERIRYLARTQNNTIDTPGEEKIEKTLPK